MDKDNPSNGSSDNEEEKPDLLTVMSMALLNRPWVGPSKSNGEEQEEKMEIGEAPKTSRNKKPEWLKEYNIEAEDFNLPEFLTNLTEEQLFEWTDYINLDFLEKLDELDEQKEELIAFFANL